MNTIQINQRKIGQNQPVYLIAEAGVNHNGSILNAKRLVDIAKYAGADAVKFQIFSAETLVTQNAGLAEYQKNKIKEKNQYNMLKKLELSYTQFKKIFKYCKQKEITFLASPFDLESVEFLESLKIDAYKIASGEITNIPLIKSIAEKHKPMIVSTGMATIKEIKEAIYMIKNIGNNQIILLHCVSEYPVPITKLNLRLIPNLSKMFKLPVGFSDHSLGILAPITATALGAAIIEKHFTINKSMIGPDHKSSLSPRELCVMIKSIKDIEQALGDGKKHLTEKEQRNKKLARKSLIAKVDIRKGTRITENEITIKRPGTGLSSKYLRYVIGKIVKHDIKKDELLKLSDLS